MGADLTPAVNRYAAAVDRFRAVMADPDATDADCDRVEDARDAAWEAVRHERRAVSR